MRLLSGIGLAALAATALTGVPNAYADSADDEVQYCHDMASLGHLGSCTALVSYARAVCIQLDKGNGWYPILKSLDASVIDKDLSSDIMVTAVADMCPWNSSALPR